MSEITAFIVQRYGHLGDEGRRMTAFLEELWVSHQDLADPHFIPEFCSGDEARLMGRFWERLLTHDLRGKGSALVHAPDGPDLKISSEAQITW